MTFIDVTHEACWVIGIDGKIVVFHAGFIATQARGYRVSGVEGQPWRFKVEKEVGCE